jgi:hypothetical protein
MPIAYIKYLPSSVASYGFDLGVDVFLIWLLTFAPRLVSSVSRELLGVLSSLFEWSGAERVSSACPKGPLRWYCLLKGRFLLHFVRTKEGLGCGEWQIPRFSIKAFNHMHLTQNINKGFSHLLLTQKMTRKPLNC